MPKELIIVARDNGDLLESLQREFAAKPDVAVIVDRRVGERRSTAHLAAQERRRAERRSQQEAELLRTLGYFRIAAGAESFIEIRRTGPPTPQQVSGRVFTWTATVSQYPPKAWRELFIDTKERTIDHSPDKVRFYHQVLIFESDEEKVVTWVKFIDAWMGCANERYAKKLDVERRARDEQAHLSRDPKARLREAAERFKNL